MNPEPWRGRRVLVTGHTGFKGTWLALWLETLGADVFGLGLDPPTAPNLHALTGRPAAGGDRIDLRDRAAVEKHMSVTTSRGNIVGGWHWFSDQVAHFRPKHFWPGNTKVTVHVDLQDVYAGDRVWGDRDHDWSWHVGPSHISYVGANTHRFRVRVNGHQVADWPTGMGQPGFETRSGTYNVLMKTPLTEMTSCSIGLACKPGSPNYYDLKVHHDVRVTDSGTFVHAAPWDSELGAANTSHGCIHLSTANAKRFYAMSIPGDVVIVTGTNRPASTTDPGMADWAIPWSQWEN